MSWPKQPPTLHWVPVHCSSPGAAQKGGSGWHWTGGQHSSPVQAPGNRQLAAGTGIWPSGQVPSAATLVHAGAGPPQHGVTQIWAGPQGLSPQEIGAPVVEPAVVVAPDVEVVEVALEAESVASWVVEPVEWSSLSPHARRHETRSARGVSRGDEGRMP